jgi:hypothetical protein
MSGPRVIYNGTIDLTDRVRPFRIDPYFIDIRGDDPDLIDVTVTDGPLVPVVGRVAEMAAWNGSTFRMCVHDVSDRWWPMVEVDDGRPGPRVLNQAFRTIAGHLLER